MSMSEAYVDALERRIKDLEVENTKLQKTIADQARTIDRLMETSE